MVKDAGIYGADCILLDLEDSVALSEKDAARFLVCEALLTLDYSGSELFVRVNDPASDLGRLELEAVVRTGKAAIRLPKTETPQDITNCDEMITAIEQKNGLPVGSTKMMAAVESALGVLHAREIATASPRMVAIAIGAEDYTADLKTSRSKEGTELYFGRNMILLAARAAGIDAIDTVFSDINDEEGFLCEVKLIKQLGFDGKSVINPRQIGPLHQLYAPTDREILHALAITEAMEEAHRNGSGVISLHGKMIDRPVVLRAQRILDLAGEARLVKVRETV
jgi:citrate lyase subunit beta/citryl-CoA lyase